MEEHFCRARSECRITGFPCRIMNCFGTLFLDEKRTPFPAAVRIAIVLNVRERFVVLLLEIGYSDQKHGIAIAIEPVFFLNCLLVCLHDEIFIGKCTH